MSNDAKDLIADLRGGVPEKCDFCGLETEPDYLHPEEAGMWICVWCIERDKAAYFGKSK